uniref:Uncharacterized protein n=1 Tax=Sphaerodactylus townsendi TaxID=933632 RepID=A0ACB8FDQ6_9SAUR
MLGANDPRSSTVISSVRSELPDVVVTVLLAVINFLAVNKLKINSDNATQNGAHDCPLQPQNNTGTFKHPLPCPRGHTTKGPPTITQALQMVAAEERGGVPVGAREWSEANHGRAMVQQRSTGPFV